MKILALESSCDETSAAVVEDGRKVLSNIIASQAEFHQQYGGVIPEYAARQHLEMIHPVIEQALQKASVTLDDIDAFAATIGPGLVGALLVGVNAAKTLSLLTNKPFLPVNHLEGHIASVYLVSQWEPPFLCLLVSGGHTQLYWIKNYQDRVLLGQTRDDAVGESYDKIARLLECPYPGGPHVDRLAQSGDPKRFTLQIADLSSTVEWSFSGLKTNVLRLTEKLKIEEQWNEQTRADLAASFQHTACQALLKVVKKAQQKPVCPKLPLPVGWHPIVIYVNALKTGSKLFHKGLYRFPILFFVQIMRR